ncbi:hypothetical protein [Streptomyces olivochromogenes]|uniref:hypothetical protein n=1 Tax=Streptomyces olivochromogenes TaxID=1963 RepID=UPI001F247D20|nr:hypothetical protein [Streptomyces olivochromogenes]
MRHVRHVRHVERAAPRLRTAGVLAAALLGAAAGPAVADGSLITVLDNSQADSILEVDRTANLQTGSGTAGSDHDGSAVDLMEALVGAEDNNGED